MKTNEISFQNDLHPGQQGSRPTVRNQTGDEKSTKDLKHPENQNLEYSNRNIPTDDHQRSSLNNNKRKRN